MKDWTITFDNGSTAIYFNMTSVQAVNCAVNDWYPAKRVIAWHETSDASSCPRLPLH